MKTRESACYPFKAGAGGLYQETTLSQDAISSTTDPKEISFDVKSKTFTSLSADWSSIMPLARASGPSGRM